MKIVEKAVQYRRAIILLLIFAAQVSLLIWAKSSVAQFENQLATFQQLLILLIIAPYAFSLWFWRDKSRQQELRQSEQSYHQSELFQLQEWIVDDSRPGLQVAALYRLRQYLSGKHGLSLMESALQTLFYSLKRSQSLSAEEEDNPLAKEVRNILLTEPEILVQVSRHRLFEGMNLSGIALRNVTLSGVNLSNCLMIGANFKDTRFVRVIMNNSDFSGSSFDGCTFDSVTALDSNFDGADFRDAQLNSIRIRPTNGEIYSSRKITLGPETRVEGSVRFNLIDMAIGAEINGKLIHASKN